MPPVKAETSSDAQGNDSHAPTTSTRRPAGSAENRFTIPAEYSKADLTAARMLVELCDGCPEDVKLTSVISWPPDERGNYDVTWVNNKDEGVWRTVSPSNMKEGASSEC